MLLLFILFVQSVVCYAVTTNSSENSDGFEAPNNTSDNPKNDLKIDVNKTLVERITQPSQTQQIERTLAPSSVNNSFKVASKKESNLENFRPSPQLDTYYEYNKFPVKPAIGEAKTFGSFSEGGYFLNSWTERPLVPPWTEKQHNQWLETNNNKRPNPWNEQMKVESNPWLDKPTTQQAWVSRVKFPTTSQGSSNERPYKFIANEEKSSNYPSGNFPVTTEGFSFNKPIETPIRNTKPVSFWEKFLGQKVNRNKNPEPIQKTFYDYNLLEKPPLHTLAKGPEQGLSGGSNPWQKVIKILTTIIPIGLLISALTPTVITVTSVNDTQSRYRAEESLQQDAANRFASSLNYVDKLNNSECRDRVLCELLVTASESKDSERHIENLLSTFAENEDLKSRKDDLLKVFDAVKNDKCTSILCRNTKHPT